MQTHQHKQQGFTLLELMIAIGIVALIMTIAYPSYNAQVVKSSRTQAQADLQSLASSVERNFTQFLSYQGITAAGVYSGVSPTSGAARYTLTVVLTPNPANPTGYYLTAVPVAGGITAGNGMLTYNPSGVNCWHIKVDAPGAPLNCGAGQTW